MRGSACSFGVQPQVYWGRKLTRFVNNRYCRIWHFRGKGTQQRMTAWLSTVRQQSESHGSAPAITLSKSDWHPIAPLLPYKKVHPITAREGTKGEEMHSSTLPSTSALDGGGWSTPRPGRFTPGKDPVPIVWEAGWPPGPVWTGAENIAPHRDSIPGPSSP